MNISWLVRLWLNVVSRCIIARGNTAIEAAKISMLGVHRPKDEFFPNANLDISRIVIENLSAQVGPAKHFDEEPSRSGYFSFLTFACMIHFFSSANVKDVFLTSVLNHMAEIWRFLHEGHGWNSISRDLSCSSKMHKVFHRSRAQPVLTIIMK
jgi:hypothetical protein